LFIRKKDDKMEYRQRDVPDNFSTASRDAEVGTAMDVFATNPRNSRPTKAVEDRDSTSEAICL
jgi:hypothetical protein